MRPFLSKERVKDSESSYTPLTMISESDSDYEPSHGLLAQEEKSQSSVKAISSFKSIPLYWRVIFAALLLIDLVTIIIGVHWYKSQDYNCMQRGNVWSPIWEDVSTSLKTVRFNGTLDAPSIYRGPPSAAVDEAWSGLDDIGSVSLDEKTFLKAGGNKDNARMPDEFGGGYMADIEILHQMHCLNFIRMAAYADHYRSIAPEWRDSNRTFHIHLDHCIEMIRTLVLCNADAGIIPFRWVENYRRPLPDFSTQHKCRNWEAVVEWAKERQVIVPTGYEWSHQPWEKVFPKPAWMPES